MRNRKLANSFATFLLSLLLTASAAAQNPNDFDAIHIKPVPWEINTGETLVFDVYLYISNLRDHHGTWKITVQSPANGMNHVASGNYDNAVSTTASLAVSFSAPSTAGNYYINWWVDVTDNVDGYTYHFTASPSGPLTVLGSSDPPPDPDPPSGDVESDIDLDYHTFTEPMQVGMEYCGYLYLENDSYDVTYYINRVWLENSGVSVNFGDYLDSDDDTLSDRDTDRFGDPFCFTPTTAGRLKLKIYVDLEDDSTDYYVDSFYVDVVDPCPAHDHKVCFDNDSYWADCNNVRNDLISDCGIPSCGTWSANYCSNNDVMHSRTCYLQGCAGGSCFSNTNSQVEVVQDCGSSYYGPWSANTCNSAGTAVVHSRTYYSQGCSASATCYTTPINQIVTVETCGNGCENDSCVAVAPVCTSTQEKYTPCTVDGCSGRTTQICVNGQWSAPSACVKSDACCGVSCSDGYYCQNGTCLLNPTCATKDHLVCHNDDVYWADCKGAVNDIFQDCPEDELRDFPGNICQNGDVYYQGILTDVYCADGACKSTSQVQELVLVQDCTDRCEANTLITGQSCVSGACQGGESHDCASDPPVCTTDNNGGRYYDGFCSPDDLRCYYAQFDSCSQGCVAETGECVPYNECEYRICHNGDLYCVDTDNVLSLERNCDEVQGCDAQTLSCIPPCTSNWVCNSPTPCINNMSTVLCQDVNMCPVSTSENPSYRIWCDSANNDCDYTYITWEQPLSVVDNDLAHFTVGWNGDCSGDVLDIRLAEVGLGLDEYFGPLRLTVDPWGWQPNGGAETFEINAFWVGDVFGNPEYRLLLYNNNDYLMQSYNLLEVEPFTSDADLVEQMERARLAGECSQSVTISDECLEYWEEMEWHFDWEHFQNQAFDFLAAAWVISCVGCVGSAVTVPISYYLCLNTGVACAAVVPVTTVATDVLLVSCPICTGTTVAESSAAVADAAILGRIDNRVKILHSQGITGETWSLITRRAGILTYIENGLKMTEIYGLSSRGKPYLTYIGRAQNFPGTQSGSFQLIKLHRDVANVGLGGFQDDLVALSKTEAEAQIQALLNMVDDGRYGSEAEWAWQLFTNNKLGNLNNYVKFRFRTQLPRGRFGQYNYETQEMAFAVLLGNVVLTGGVSMPRSLAIRGVVLKHEMGHAGTENLIKQLRVWNASPRYYVLESNNEYYWAHEFINDVIARDAMLSDNLRYTEYVDGFYAIIHDPRRTEPFVNSAINAFRIATDNALDDYQRTEMRYAGQYLLKMAHVSDQPTAQAIEQRLLSEFGSQQLQIWQTEMRQLELDALVMHNDLVHSGMTQASAELHRILFDYKYIRQSVVPTPQRNTALEVIPAAGIETERPQASIFDLGPDSETPSTESEGVRTQVTYEGVPGQTTASQGCRTLVGQSTWGALFLMIFILARRRK